MSALLTRLRRTAIRYLRQGGRTRTDDYLHRQRQGAAGVGNWAFIHINKCGGTSVEHALNIPKIHDTARQRRDILGPDRWAAMTTFSIVRHPYERVPSLYKYRIRTGQTGMGEASIGLDDWVRATFRDRDPAYYDKPLMFLPAHDWLSDETGALIVDRIFKLEEIATAWPEIQSITGSTAPLPVKNATSGRADTALSADSRTIIRSAFARDFEAFGYVP